MVDNLFTLAAAQEAASSQEWATDDAFIRSLDRAQAYSLGELQALHASYALARELAGDEEEDIERDLSRCSYAQGYVKQLVFGCKTCAVDGGICVCCNEHCHEGHDLFPVDPKRHFRCDCPTSTFASPCALEGRTDQLATVFASATEKLPPNSENRYGQNFRNRFCWCGKEYGDESVAAETMIQCGLCEEWFHETHLNLRQPSRAPLDPLNTNPDDLSAPPVLLRADEHVVLLCEGCVLAPENAPLADYFATERFVGIVKGEDGKWERAGFVEGVDEEDDTDDEQQGDGADAPPPPSAPTSTAFTADPLDAAGLPKRPAPASPSEDVPPPVKRARPSSPCTLATAQRPARARALLEKRQGESAGHNGWGTGRCDVFVQPGWRRVLCRCEVHAPLLEKHPFLLTMTEPVWQPPPLALDRPTSGPTAGAAGHAQAEAAEAAQLVSQLSASLGHQGAVDVVRRAQAGLDDMSASLAAFVARWAAEAGGRGGEAPVLTRQSIEEFFEEWKEKMRKAGQLP